MRRNRLDLFRLPQDLRIEILLRLPFQSILSCKSLSKQWKNFITDPKFFTIYCHKSKSIAVFFNKQRLSCALIRHTGRNKITRYPPYPSYMVCQLPIDLPQYDKRDNQLLSGSSNGIICVKTGKDQFFIFNLFTGSSYTVENPSLRQYSSNCLICYGFGYDHYADDHKILVSFDYNNTLFWIYSFKARNWELFNGGFPGGFPDVTKYEFLFPGAYSYNSVLHWICRVRENQKAIVTYDLHTHGFGETFVPDDYSLGYATVTELSGQLCYVNQISKSDELMDIEVYRVGEYWTKLFTFSTSRIDDNNIPLSRLAHTALYAYGDGRKVVLFVCNENSKWFWYDINKKKIGFTTCEYRISCSNRSSISFF